MPIDPIRMSQFFALPGAAELVEAFSAIPPGEVRDSAVSHVQVLARACGWTPPLPFEAHHTPRQIGPPPKLTSPFAADLQSTSLEGQIVERALRGEPEHHIADDLGVKLAVVVRLKRKAVKEGGVIFPDDADRPKPKGKFAKGKSPLKGRKIAGLPIPPPPYWWEDPNSPVWDNWRVLPAYSENPKGSLAAVGPNDIRSFATMTDAAKRRGLTLRQYIKHRYAILGRVEKGERPTQVAIDMKVAPHEVYGLLAKVGRGRMEATLQIAQEAARSPPVSTAAPDPEPPPALAQEPAEPIGRTGSPIPAHRLASALTARALAATKYGFPDVRAFEHARDRVRELRLQGIGPAVIAGRLGQPQNFVKNAIDYWRDQGVTWPQISVGAEIRERTG